MNDTKAQQIFITIAADFTYYYTLATIINNKEIPVCFASYLID